MATASTPGLESRMPPDGVSTCAKASSGSIRFPPAAITDGSCRRIADTTTCARERSSMSMPFVNAASSLA